MTTGFALTTEQVAAIEDDSIRILQQLIRIPSVNYGEGKGDEKAVAEYVANSLKEVGIESEFVVSAEKRVSVVSRIPGTDTKRSGLVVHGHIDTVPADAKDWSVDPWSGEIKDGFVWGRGAVDMKDGCAQFLAIVRGWKRYGYQPPRNILLIFFADEEAGGSFGSRWMIKNRPEIFEGYNEAISEVGGFSVTISGGHRLYWVQTAEKGISWMKLTAKGTAGHGSFINRDNPVTKLTRAIARIGDFEWPVRETKTGAKFWGKIAELVGEKYDPSNPRPLQKYIGNAARMMGATVQNTSNPTQLDAGYKANVIPQVASAVVDGRFLPGHEDELMATIRELAGDDADVEIMVRDNALEVPFEGALVQAMCDSISDEDPEGIPVPYVMSGGTDNKALADLGIVGYGFTPLKLPADLDFFALFHGVDERVPVEGVKFGVRTLLRFFERI
jgi:acetylornithine deacetylase/succinyl-diaminopimelate desuccinylase-like protein